MKSGQISESKNVYKNERKIIEAEYKDKESETERRRGENRERGMERVRKREGERKGGKKRDCRYRHLQS